LDDFSFIAYKLYPNEHIKKLGMETSDEIRQQYKRRRTPMFCGYIFLTAMLLILTMFCRRIEAFLFSTTPSRRSLPESTFALPLSSSDEDLTNDNNSERYSRTVRLREEAESPSRKGRYFFYLNIAGGATTSLFISIARIAAALSGVNTDLMDESIRNAIIDIVGLCVVVYFWKQDQVAEESRLRRATKGAELAKLSVRTSKALLVNSVSSNEMVDLQQMSGSLTFTTTLASFRRERGIEKRIVIAAAGCKKIDQVLKEAQALQSELADNDLVVVPAVIPQGVAHSWKT
jgi:hypothetical protein